MSEANSENVCKPVFILRGHRTPIQSITFEWKKKRTTRGRRRREDKQKQTQSSSAASSTAAAGSSSGSNGLDELQLLSCDAGGVVKIWNLTNRRALVTLQVKPETEQQQSSSSSPVLHALLADCCIPVTIHSTAPTTAQSADISSHATVLTTAATATVDSCF